MWYVLWIYIDSQDITYWLANNYEYIYNYICIQIIFTYAIDVHAATECCCSNFHHSAFMKFDLLVKSVTTQRQNDAYILVGTLLLLI